MLTATSLRLFLCQLTFVRIRDLHAKVVHTANTALIYVYYLLFILFPFSVL